LGVQGITVARQRYALAWPWLSLAVLAAFWMLAPIPATSDAANYWALELSDPYRNRWAEPESFVYSPAFGQVIYPLTLLPFEVFYKLVQAINLACIWWLVGPLAAPALLFPPVLSELTTGQIHLPLAVMCVVALHHPSAWAFGILTKVTPGVGVVWHATRGEWRGVAAALAATAGVIAISSVSWPTAWVEWIHLLTESIVRTVGNFAVSEWPAMFRLPIATGLMVMAAWRNRPAAVPLLVLFSLPMIWFGALAMVLAVPRASRLCSPGTGGRERSARSAPDT
jgi:Glycosyltransferase family 87